LFAEEDSAEAQAVAGKWKATNCDVFGWWGSLVSPPKKEKKEPHRHRLVEEEEGVGWIEALCK